MERQYNSQNKQDKQWSTKRYIEKKINMEKHEPHWKPGWTHMLRGLMQTDNSKVHIRTLIITVLLLYMPSKVKRQGSVNIVIIYK